MASTFKKFIAKELGWDTRVWDGDKETGSLADALEEAKSQARNRKDPVGVYQLVQTVQGVRKDEDFAFEKIS